MLIYVCIESHLYSRVTVSCVTALQVKVSSKAEYEKRTIKKYVSKLQTTVFILIRSQEYGSAPHLFTGWKEEGRIVILGKRTCIFPRKYFTMYHALWTNDLFLRRRFYRRAKKSSALTGGHCMNCSALFLDIHTDDSVCRHHPGYLRKCGRSWYILIPEFMYSKAHSWRFAIFMFYCTLYMEAKLRNNCRYL